jgi:hypothetical protein
MNVEIANEIVERTLEDGLQSLVLPSVEASAELWEHGTNSLIAHRLQDHLRPTERWARKIPGQCSPTHASLGTMTLGRLLANRPTRSGWRAMRRQIWAHPGVVDLNTSTDWSWPRRRLTHIARKLHLLK